MSDAWRVHYEGPNVFCATDREPKRCKIVLECPQGLAAGTDVRVTLRSFRAFCNGPKGWSFQGMELEQGTGRVVLGQDLPRNWQEMQWGGTTPGGGGILGRTQNGIYLCTAQVTGALSKGARLAFAFECLLSIHAWIDAYLAVKVRAMEDEAFAQVGAVVRLETVAGPAWRLEVRCRAVADGEGRTRTVIMATDEFLNPVRDYEGRLSLQADDVVEGLPGKIVIGPADGGQCTLEGLRVGAAGPVRIVAQDAQLGVGGQSGIALGEPVGEAGHFFGAIHFHTRYRADRASGDRIRWSDRVAGDARAVRRGV